MATEIERKFLVRSDAWRDAADAGVHYRQGYLASEPDCSIRVRSGGGRAFLNIKGATLGVRRTEFEFPIPVNDAEELLDRFCAQSSIEKTRYHVPFADHLWEVDVFAGANAGLVVAEIELAHESEDFARPPWLGEEVSDDPRYYNVCLVRHPYREWADGEAC